MKKLVLSILFLFICYSIQAQCPTGSINLSSQQDINDFVSQYPNCTEITGSVSISGEVNDLSALTQLTTIEGALQIWGSHLTNIQGLNNLTSVRTLYLVENDSLINLTGLESLSTADYVIIGDFFPVEHSDAGNGALTNLAGLDNLTSVKELSIIDNRALTDLTGLGSLTSAQLIGIASNTSLSNVTSLENLTSVKSLSISRSNNLTNLTGLENIDPDTLTNVSISLNPNLSICQVESICNYLELGGTASINNNAPGCNSRAEVEVACGFNGQCDIILMTQAEVNSFATTYPDCTEVGHLIITSPAIHDISPLSQITSIERLLIQDTHLTDLTGLDNLTSADSLAVFDNDSLVNLAGLSSLTSISNDLIIARNDSLADLTGLNNLTTIGNDLLIDRNENLADLSSLNNLTTIGNDLKIERNVNLTLLAGLDNLTSIGNELSLRVNLRLVSLNGLSNLTSVGESLYIRSNTSLVSLSGLQNIDPGTLTDVSIHGNNNLSVCQVESICNYLQTGGTSSIEDNAPGCNSSAEVEAACTLGGQCGIILTTQAEVNSFSTDYPNCTEVGYLVIASPAIQDISPLSQITSIEGMLLIERTNLTDLTGLDNLTSVGSLIIAGNNTLVNLTGLENLNTADYVLIGRFTDIPNSLQNKVLINLAGLDNLSLVDTLFIFNNPVMTDLTGLNNLTSAGYISIHSNPVLINLNGLESLTSIGNDLLIISNNNLGDLTGLENLMSVGNDLNIRFNDNLVNLASLNNLMSIGNDLRIFHSDNLESLIGLDNLMSIGNYLWIESNSKLDNFIGLNNLTSIGRSLIVGSNENLTDFSGLENLTFVEQRIQITDNESLNDLNGIQNINPDAIEETLHIANNPLLSVCNLPNICDYLENGSSSFLSNNAPNCNSSAEVLDACDALPIEMSAPLRVYLDGQTAILRWRTDTETNNAGFEIQRSKDGIEWKKINWQAGQGTTTSPHTYTHRDPKPLFGTSYYRLKQVDFDGNFEYSNAVSLRYIPAVVEISPNPGDGKFIIQGIPQGSYQIHDTTGRIIQSGNMQNDLSIDISQEAQGVYFISIQIENETITKRIIKM